ncbi:MAG TPA: hypothetical protein VMJ34_23600 [Bryobacteraceae bacterium]|nr:hypothetical protein [Bryobacteraceae bacterium]
MISMIQVHFIELHWEAIARRALARIREEVPHSHTLPDAVILQRVSDLFGHLGDWLAAGDPDAIATRYEQMGRERAERHHLCDLVRAFQIIRQCAVDYARDHQMNENTVALRSESELEYRIDRFFDHVIYHVVKGYEHALVAAGR